MFCTQCGKEVKDGQSFCTACGNRMELPALMCPTCENPVKGDQKFCLNCGAEIYQMDEADFDDDTAEDEEDDELTTHESKLSWTSTLILAIIIGSLLGILITIILRKP